MMSLSEMLDKYKYCGGGWHRVYDGRDCVG